ncbi:hypothetical protein [Coleofasciculus sp. E2-BRE-01]|uniref:hypothetical protein n=1 Tax=Coleofasciculus sp. E2-BRE-01 TaxID=3069524 RepID=UPI0040636EF5
MQAGRPYKARLFPSGQLNRAIACFLWVNSITRSLSDSQQAPILFPPLREEG